jgi:hypothetical protein
MWEGLPVITFYFYKTDHFVSQKLVFFYKIVKFEKLLNLIFKKKFTSFQRICYLFLPQRTLLPTVTEWNQSISPSPPPPPTTCCPITGPSPHMGQLLDSGTWHQQQLIQLAAFFTPCSHPQTQCFISQLELAVSSTGILERIKNFTIPKSFI